jgi:hypothetical protein
MGIVSLVAGLALGQPCRHGDRSHHYRTSLLGCPGADDAAQTHYPLRHIYDQWP